MTIYIEVPEKQQIIKH